MIKGTLCLSSLCGVRLQVYNPDDSKATMAFTSTACWVGKESCNLKTLYGNSFFPFPFTPVFLKLLCEHRAPGWPQTFLARLEHG